MSTSEHVTGPILFGLGNPLLDISAVTPASFLSKYEVPPKGAILAEEKHLPLFSELISNYDVEYTAGGAEQNVIRAAQWMLQIPNMTAYVGCVGKDQNGKILQERAENDGVSVHYLVDENVRTGTCAALILDKDRSLVADLAAAQHYKISHLLRDDIQKLIKIATFFYASGFFLTVSPESLIHIGKHANEHNKVFAWNLAAEFLTHAFWQPMQDTLPYVDILFGNDLEALAFGKRQGWEEDVDKIALGIASLPKVNTKRSRLVVITQGSKRTVIATEGQVKHYQPTSVPDEEIVDLNGAGDSFAGGFLSRYIFGKSLEESVAAGHYCAGCTIRLSGVKYIGKPAFTYHS